MSELVSLDDWNKSVWDKYVKEWRDSLKPNGIACPMCGIELVDYDKIPYEGHKLGPPRVTVMCPVCNYIGYRLTEGVR